MASYMHREYEHVYTHPGSEHQLPGDVLKVQETVQYLFFRQTRTRIKRLKSLPGGRQGFWGKLENSE